MLVLPLVALSAASCPAIAAFPLPLPLLWPLLPVLGRAAVAYVGALPPHLPQPLLLVGCGGAVLVCTVALLLLLLVVLVLVLLLIGLQVLLVDAERAQRPSQAVSQVAHVRAVALVPLVLVGGIALRCGEGARGRDGGDC